MSSHRRVRRLISLLPPLLALSLGPAAGLGVAQPAAAAPAAGGPQAAPKVLRLASRTAETGFDMAQVQDTHSRSIIEAIFEAPLRYDFLARPHVIRTNTAARMPEVNAEATRFVFDIQPGIRFTDHPAFKGKPRELTAQDYVYTIKRHYDPALKSPSLYIFEGAQLLGLNELRAKALKSGKPFDYDTEVPGLRALSRYQFEVRIAKSDPRFLHYFADHSLVGAMAREVVESYSAAEVMAHPVGTGPFKLGAWRRSSQVVLERNPSYREVFYDEHAAADYTAGRAIEHELKGRRMPMLDRIELDVVEQSQPRWLAFLGREHDYLEQVPEEFTPRVLKGAELLPNLKAMGLQTSRYFRSDVNITYFNMEHPLVGGYTPDKVALRRAINLAIDLDKELRLVRKGQAIAAQGPVCPGVYGYDPAFKSINSAYDLGAAKALLDLYGYTDKDGDGWRDQPDGKPLVLEFNSQSDSLARDQQEQWQKNLKALGIRIQFKIQQWPENLKASRAGKLMMWNVNWTASSPDADFMLTLGYGPSKGSANHARLQLPEYDRLYELQRRLPDGPERLQAIREAVRLMVAYAPYKIHVHRIFTDVAQPWVRGFVRNPFLRASWRYYDIDTAEQARILAGGKPKVAARPAANASPQASAPGSSPLSATLRPGPSPSSAARP
ncbi:MAG: bicyclomycin resistance protein [Burkholderiaceae bacterium]|nr:MAG: bicyclomycin resistance protein [Burkholderiaceae bacterium]